MQEGKKNNEKEEILTDLKGTIESLVKGEEPELSQEDAIKAYRGERPLRHRRRKKAASEDDDVEDDERLKKLKQELLVSLEKVNKLAKQLFGDKEFKNVKELKIEEKNQRAKGKEQSIDKTKSKEQERSREE